MNMINLRGTTILMVTHAKDIVDKMEKRVIAIENGRIVRDEFGMYGYKQALMGDDPAFTDDAIKDPLKRDTLSATRRTFRRYRDRAAQGRDGQRDDRTRFNRGGQNR